MKLNLKLADINAYELVHALAMERGVWITAAQEEGRQNTEAEKITICVLTALEHAIGKAANASDPEFDYAGAQFRPEPEKG